MTKVKAIETTDGQIFKDLADAKTHELEIIFRGDNTITTDDEIKAARHVMQYADRILNVLTMKASSHPGARKANGATRKPRTVKLAAPATKAQGGLIIRGEEIAG